MTYRFDPNINPLADDLLRLSMAPASRFSLPERRALARILAGKLYGLELHSDFSFPHWRPIFHEAGDSQLVVVDVFIDSDDLKERVNVLFEDPYGEFQLIIVSIGVDGVIELFNGPWNSSTREAFSREIDRKAIGDNSAVAQEHTRIQPRSDEEVSRDYFGQDFDNHDLASSIDGGGGGNRRGGRGGEGGGQSGGRDGADGGAGAGGAGEVLNHPVLFAVDGYLFDAILEQT